MIICLMLTFRIRSSSTVSDVMVWRSNGKRSGAIRASSVSGSGVRFGSDRRGSRGGGDSVRAKKEAPDVIRSREFLNVGTG